MKSDFHLKRSIKIKGVTYKVKQLNKVLDDQGIECQGWVDKHKKVIAIMRGLDPLEKKLTFMHEVAHAYLHECHTTEGLDHQLEEVVIETMLRGLSEHFNFSWKKK